MLHLLLALLCLLGSFSSSSRLPRKMINLIDLSDKCIDYHQAWAWQSQLVDHHISLQQTPPFIGNDPAVINSQRGITDGGGACDQECLNTGSLLVLQHKSVYTLGSGTKASSGPFENTCPDGYPLNYDTVQVDRAGEATYHGPGQVVLYPILDLTHYERDINCYLRRLESVVIKAVRSFGITASRIETPGYTGVWVADRYKIAAIGLKIRRWVTMHGVAVNVHPDMRYFANIVPCGIIDKQVGSIRQLMDSSRDTTGIIDYSGIIADGGIGGRVRNDNVIDEEDGLLQAVVRELVQCFLDEFECAVDTTMGGEQAMNYLRQMGDD